MKNATDLTYYSQKINARTSYVLYYILIQLFIESDRIIWLLDGIKLERWNGTI